MQKFRKLLTNLKYVTKSLLKTITHYAKNEREKPYVMFCQLQTKFLLNYQLELRVKILNQNINHCLVKGTRLKFLNKQFIKFYAV